MTFDASKSKIALEANKKGSRKGLDPLLRTVAGVVSQSAIPTNISSRENNRSIC